MAQAIFPPSGGFRIKYTRYTAAGAFTHTFDPNCAFYDRIIRGAGGSGSCSSNGGGGGGGASARIVHKNLKPLGATESGTIGAGGAAVSISGAGDVAGNNGGNTTVGTGVNLATSQGGRGGASIASLGTGRNGGAGGTQLFPATTSAANGGTTGAAPGFSIPGYDSHSDGAGGGAGGNASAVAAITGGGCPGFIRAASAVNGGDGAGSDEGYGGQGGATNTNGNDATTPGSGGGGGGRRTSGTVFSGKGADGSVIYIEYLSA